MTTTPTAYTPVADIEGVRPLFYSFGTLYILVWCADAYGGRHGYHVNLKLGREAEAPVLLPFELLPPLLPILTCSDTRSCIHLHPPAAADHAPL